MPENVTAVAERPPRVPAGSEFTPLLRTVKGQGLLDRRQGWYALAIAVNALALTGVVAGVVLIGHSWWVLLLARCSR
ncbi:hypothetical protein QFZ24_008259 [Streptomyces phaeochromogenes]|jgi:hypothetical protein|nr:hypothetical protein [Streptomyces phaeochromogenes]